MSTAQDICAGAAFNTLTLINANPPTGTSYLYQWQSSPDDITYSNLIGETGTTLSGRVIANDTYYRVLIRYRNTPACEKATPGVLIDVNPSHTLNQVAGTLSPQSVCPSIAMNPIVLE